MLNLWLLKVPVLAVWLVGICCGMTAETPAAESVVIENVPHIIQKPDFCGEACAAMFLNKLGYKATQDDVFDQSGLDPLLARGCYTRELSVALQNVGFDIGPVWYQVPAATAAGAMNRQLGSLLADLKRGVPAIVCMHYDERPNTTEHFRLMLGYDEKRDELIYHEPAVVNGGYQRMPRTKFLQLWPLKYKQDQWTLVHFRLDPKRVRLPASTKQHTPADFAQHVRKLKSKLPNDTFHIVIQEPFVVVGDESAETVKLRSDKTVKWAVDRLKKDYFGKDPNHIVTIWLFKDKASYEANTKTLFGAVPSTPYGYYSPTYRALVMNISTGTGTLVHEIVHPFMESNFPECPAWFNEGLASLYEQCGDHEGKIWGYTNWRLRGLQGTIQNGRLPTFKQLCGTTTRQFYDDDRGTNYAQARYLCYYLQQNGKLRSFYHAFRKAAAQQQDLSGYKTLESVLGNPDMAAFANDWAIYTAKLRFP